MDRRSWLWRREKSPGETESSGGSMSSHSERFSDDQIYSNQSFQSPEAELQPEVERGVKALSQKLSEALLNIGIKEDLVKQHSKVAEEAVEGWEKAEKDVLALRQQVEVLTLQNSSLEDRVGHLDGALKECLRQLRQTREENEKKTSEWQMTKAQLEKQVSDLCSRLQSAEPSTEISALKLELASMAEELELRFIERELSNQAAEQASKLHLESVKKASQFEAECRRLRKALAAKASQAIAAIEEFQSTPAREINLMDDFLEMERLVALPEKNRISQVEEVLKRVEMEKQNVEMELRERENELKDAKSQLEALLVNAGETTEKELESVKAIVSVLQERVKRSELEVVELKSQLDIERREAESRLEKKLEAESRLATLETEVGKERAKCQELQGELESLNLKVEKELVLKVHSLETEVEKERALSKKMARDLEEEISRLQRHPNPIKQDTELALPASKFADCQKTIASLSRQLKTLATLEDLLIQ